MKKKIVLGLPKDFGFYSALESNLNNLGFEVINVSFDIANPPMKIGRYVRPVRPSFKRWPSV